MTAPVALQLYTLRNAAQEDFEGTVCKVADIGYVGVELAGFPGTTVEAARKLFDELELEVCSAHLPSRSAGASPSLSKRPKHSASLA